MPQEGWVAPAEPQEPGWTPGVQGTLSPADEGTLATVGVDPNDGAAALRTLAALLRVLQRRQLLDPDELAAELREGRAHEQAGQEPGAAPENFGGQEPQHPAGHDPMAQDAPAPQDLEGFPDV
jgi:hypothetical protein